MAKIAKRPKATRSITSSLVDTSDLVRYTQAIFLSVANTGKIARITNTQYTSKDKVGMRIYYARWYWSFPFYHELFTTTQAELTFGLCTVGNGGDVPTSPETLGVIDFHRQYTTLPAGAVVDPLTSEMPAKYELMPAPLVHPASLYYFYDTNNFTNILTGYLELLYTMEDLQDATYNDLLREMISTQTI